MREQRSDRKGHQAQGPQDHPGYVPLSSHGGRKGKPVQSHENLSIEERIKKLNKSFGNGSKYRSSDGAGETGQSNKAKET